MNRVAFLICKFVSKKTRRCTSSFCAARKAVLKNMAGKGLTHTNFQRQTVQWVGRRC